MFNLTTHDREVQDSANMLFTKREDLTHDGITYQIVVKSSKTPLLTVPGHNMYSTMQVLDMNKKEVTHELYPSMLSEAQAERIIKSVKENVAEWINKVN
ncbi:MAG: hypothetical protein IT212_07460 [Bacteroidia bacterium]|nr:hypothetical protein [Bacteroidia bacterium]